MSDPVLLWLGGLGLGALFTIGALHKLRTMPAFTAAIAGYRLLPAPLAVLAAPLLVLAELAAGLAALAVPFAAAAGRAGMAACAAILLIYAGAIAINIARGNTAIDCGCFGFGARGPGLRRGMILRNLALAALALPALAGTPPRGLVWLDGLTLVGGLAVLALLHIGGELSLNLPRKEYAA